MDKEELTAWGISENIRQVIENGFSFNEETGEVLFETEDLDKLQDALDEKINSICGIIKLQKERADRFKKRKQEIERFEKEANNKAEYLKKYLDSLLHLNGKDKYKTENYSIYYKDTVVASISDEVALRNWIESSADYKERFYKVPEIKKDELKKFSVMEEVEIDGFEMNQNSSIVIK